MLPYNCTVCPINHFLDSPSHLNHSNICQVLVSNISYSSYILNLFHTAYVCFVVWSSNNASTPQSIHSSIISLYFYHFGSLSWSAPSCFYLLIYLPTYLSIYQFIYLSIYPSIYLSIYLSIHPSILLSSLYISSVVDKPTKQQFWENTICRQRFCFVNIIMYYFEKEKIHLKNKI